MPRIAAALLGLCLLTGLSACNRVVTSTPLFSAQDAAGAPVLRDGLWRVEGELVAPGYDHPPGDKVFDMRRRATRWPDCAEWIVVRGGEILHPGGPGKSRPEWQRTPFVLAAGDPLILQAGMIDPDPAETEYGYFGLAPTKTDDGGRVVALDLWITLCGAPPAQGEGQPTRYLTWELLPGLTGKGDNCTTGSKDAVRAATIASAALSKDRASLRWVRDSYP